MTDKRFDFYPATFEERTAVFQSLREAWDTQIGETLQITDEDLHLMLRRTRWDAESIFAGISDLRARARHPFDEQAPEKHAMNYFLSAVRRRSMARQQSAEVEQVAA
jgi:hypothetical protein